MSPKKQRPQPSIAQEKGLTYAATVAWRASEPEHMLSVIKLLTCGKRIAYQLKTGDALIERSRAIVATSFLNNYPQCDVMVQIDSDIMFKPEDVFLIADQARSIGGVVCGLYPTRSRERPWPASFPEIGVEIDTTKPTPVPIRYPATGFMAVPRKIIERLSQDVPLCHPGEGIQHYPMFNPFWEKDDNDVWVNLSEDYAFGRRVLNAGFKIYCSPSVRLKHIGTYAYRLEDMAQRPLPDIEHLVITRTDQVAGGPIGYEIRGPEGVLAEIAADR